MAYLITIVLITSVALAENSISRKNVSMENPHSNFVEEYPEVHASPKTERSRLQAPPARPKVPGHAKNEPVELKNVSLHMGKKILKGGVLSAASNAPNSPVSWRRFDLPDGSPLINTDGSNQLSEVIDDMTKRPYLVSIRMSNVHVCGGSLIDVLWVLTAAKCVQFDAADMSVLAGTPYIYKMHVEDGVMQLRLVEMAISHDNFIEPYKLNNIALIKVKRPFIRSRWVNVLPIPSVPYSNLDAMCTTCNWVSVDNTRYEHLICQKITLMNQETCAQQPFLAGTSSNFLCSLARVADVRITQISNGGPVVCGDKGAGILFHTSVLDNNVYRFFTRIDQFIPFITNHIQVIQPPPTRDPANNDLISTLLKGFKLRLNVTLTGKFCLPDAA